MLRCFTSIPKLRHFNGSEAQEYNKPVLRIKTLLLTRIFPVLHARDHYYLYHNKLFPKDSPLTRPVTATRDTESCRRPELSARKVWGYKGSKKRRSRYMSTWSTIRRRAEPYYINYFNYYIQYTSALQQAVRVFTYFDRVRTVGMERDYSWSSVLFQAVCVHSEFPGNRATDPNRK